jgi:hypothetical protein
LNFEENGTVLLYKYRLECTWDILICKGNSFKQLAVSRLYSFLIDSYGKFNSTSKRLQGAVIVMVVCLAIVLFYFIIYFFVVHRANVLLKPYIESDSLIANSSVMHQRPPLFPADRFSIIQEQNSLLQQRKLHHLNMALYFFENSYATTIVLMVLSVFGALVLFALINYGWQYSSIRLKAIFFGILIGSLFYSILPTVFNQKDNFERNLSKYLDYSNSQIDIYDRISNLNLQAIIVDTTNHTWKRDTLNYFKNIDATIDSNYLLINRLNQFVLTIDPEKVKSIKEMYQVMQETTKARAEAKDSIIRK